MSWPPDYSKVLLERSERYDELCADSSWWLGAKAYYADHPHEFIEHWCITFDPRNVPTDKPETMPFIMFERQHDFVDFLLECIEVQSNGLVEKCRDMGATWVCAAFSVWLWLFKTGSSVGWGSRKEMLVDKLGDPDSIFEKIRKIIEHLPHQFMPAGFIPKEHATYMKIINPENDATITGEAGDNIGRGGRKLIYFKDESAHYIRAENIEAALSENTNVQIDISSVNGTANMFYRNRMSGELWTGKGSVKKGVTSVFVFDWSDHPDKTQEWYERRKADAERKGMLHVFNREVERDYSGSIENTVIPAKWVKAAIDAHIKLGIDSDGKTISALDVADEGVDKNAQAIVKGVILNFVDDWAKGDVGQTANKAIANCREHKVNSLQYDCIGVGAGVKSETNRLKREGLLPKHLEIVKWNAGQPVLFPEQYVIKGDNESPKWKDFCANIKGQGWWCLRQRFEKTYRAINEGIEYPHDELISLSSAIPKIHELTNELSQATFGHDGKGKTVINKKPAGTKSPNLADAVVMAYWPIQKAGFFA